ncbi:hypothetical protein AMECASPLE_016854 [Ameca splendens]|uniref:Polypeptide N-acetylgalactosaminyltransferase 9 n=1 Tax=Ameca splendens TaxID=208324 RepID=A0ABV0XR65_9TELE
MEVLPCARVAHIERTKKPYNNDIDYYAKRNALRAAEVWMDEYKSHVYMAWNIPMNNPGVDFGDVSERVALRKRMQCRSFRWYLEHVYPEMRIYNNTITYGEYPANGFHRVTSTEVALFQICRQAGKRLPCEVTQQLQQTCVPSVTKHQHCTALSLAYQPDRVEPSPTTAHDRYVTTWK